MARDITAALVFVFLVGVGVNIININIELYEIKERIVKFEASLNQIENNCEEFYMGDPV